MEITLLVQRFCSAVAKLTRETLYKQVILPQYLCEKPNGGPHLHPFLLTRNTLIQDILLLLTCDKYNQNLSKIFQNLQGFLAVYPSICKILSKFLRNFHQNDLNIFFGKNFFQDRPHFFKMSTTFKTPLTKTKQITNRKIINNPKKSPKIFL